MHPKGSRGKGVGVAELEIVAPVCAECGAAMRLQSTNRFTYADGSPKKFWSCTRWPACNGMHGAHQDGRPLGTPANKETKEWRIKAHDAFDRLWKVERRMARSVAYRWMQARMGLTDDEAHIGKFNITKCKWLIRLVEEFLAKAAT